MPESFLPHPEEVIEQALNIIAKEYFDKGDKKAVKIIQESILFLGWYEKDEIAIESMKWNLDQMLKDSKLKDIQLLNLKKSRDDWAKIRLIKEKLDYN